MKTVRQFSRVGPCLMLGELVMQTGTRIFYRLRDGKTAWAMKSSELLVHLEPCPSCRDHERSISPTFLGAKVTPPVKVSCRFGIGAPSATQFPASALLAAKERPGILIEPKPSNGIIVPRVMRSAPALKLATAA